jgi:SulP family sulfate permease
LINLAGTCRKRGIRLILCGLAHQPLEMATRSGLNAQVQLCDRAPDLASGLAMATANAQPSMGAGAQ